MNEVAADRRLLPEALALLAGEGRRRTPEQMLAALHARFREEGREKLADLVYEMMKACLREFPDFASRIVLAEEPRRPEVISGEMVTMRDCLAGVAAAPDLSTVARVTPAQEQALADAEKCLSVLERLEGRTGRQQLAAALQRAYLGRHQEAEDQLRKLLERGDLAGTIRFYALLNLAFALLRRDRFAEGLPVAQAAQKLDPSHPVPYANIATAAAGLGQTEVFLEAVEGMRRRHREQASDYIRTWFINWLPVHARQVGLSAERIQALQGMEEKP